jgi:phosphocarrier protein HPr
MIQQDIEVINTLGLHARPAAQFVKIASLSDSEVFIEKDGVRVNGKSIMGVMMLAAEMGSRLTIIVDGPDEGELMVKLVELFKNKFYEE